MKKNNESNSSTSITGVTSDSREVKKGYAFVAIKGLTHDGHDFIDDVIKKGAVVVYGERELSKQNYIKVEDSRQKLGELASEFYGNPSNKLKVIGVTGTKGKTTTAYMIYHILSKLGKKVGLVTSISAKIGEKEVDTGFHVTNPDIVSLNKFLSEMVMEGCEYAVVEVTSHGIDQGRVVGINFAATVLTNIAPEHLDYHKTFENYKKIKMSFINSGKIKVMGAKSTKINLFPGLFNNLDAQTAVNTVKAFGLNEGDAMSVLQSFKLPEGRMEEIKTNKDFKIFIDFAHTPDSLLAALTYLKSIKKGKLISVFGCAGERDRRKRLKMGKLSTELADFSIFTAEDPRTEKIYDILRSMEKKATKGKFISINERAEAIAFALNSAKKNDIVAFFGKGHEKTMCYETFEHPWSDRELIERLVSPLEDVSAVVLAAGKGVRMKNPTPKPLRMICGRPMLAYTIENLRKIGILDITTVVGFKKNQVMKRFVGAMKFAVQDNPKGGTADAVKAGLMEVSKKSDTLLVINGDDSAFYKPETIKAILDIHKARGRKLTFVSLIKKDPTGLGRVVRGKNGLITKIVEEKDATSEERKIKEVNDGLYVFDKEWIMENINKVKKGPQGEYYLVDLVKLAIDQNDRMATYTLPNDDEWHGINTPEQLASAQIKMSARLNSLNQ